jgi:hypothetical protein
LAGTYYTCYRNNPGPLWMATSSIRTGEFFHVEWDKSGQCSLLRLANISYLQ